ncbi:MAG TPA: hypothetical protein VN231_01550 [Allosphingosinicella sp.]|nr:hypothetical protein [Allosphingosinicella sp.]
MIKIGKRRALTAALLAAGYVAWAAPASAQATRTWVSGVGDDVNPCSRTAPCKTFAGAISKTAAGGEINCLDPGGFGAVTIVKSMTINCLYTEGGALAGGNGIVINAAATDVVVLRGLDIFGVSPPSNGVRFVAGGALHIEDSIIRRFNAANSQGVSFQPSGASRLVIHRTTIADNGTGASGGGILVQPTGAGSARLTLVDVTLRDNANNNLRIDTTGSTGGATINIENSQFIGSGTGVSLNVPNGTGSVAVMINGAYVTLAGTGIAANGTNARIRVANSTITGNATGVSITGGANVNTFGNNRLEGNGADGTFTLPIINPE